MNGKRTIIDASPVERAVDFLNGEGFAFGVAWIRNVASGDGAEAVISELSAYQQPDGGFARLEIDIKSPVSNPFATRLAMSVLATTRPPEGDVRWLVRQPLVGRLERWLDAAQADDGDWHFAPQVYEHELAPWYAGWSFPSLNPAASLAGLARRLGIGSKRLHDRVRRLFDEKATLAEAETGEFYNVLPYFEYLGSVVEHPAREAFLDALARNVVRNVESGGYDDAEHFFVHVEPAGPDLARRLPARLVEQQLARLVAAQQEDGGWPTPYDRAWRPWSAATNAVTLLRHGIR